MRAFLLVISGHQSSIPAHHTHTEWLLESIRLDEHTSLIQNTPLISILLCCHIFGRTSHSQPWCWKFCLFEHLTVSSKTAGGSRLQMWRQVKRAPGKKSLIYERDGAALHVEEQQHIVWYGTAGWRQSFTGVEWAGGSKNDADVGFVVGQKTLGVQAFDANEQNEQKKLNVVVLIFHLSPGTFKKWNFDIEISERWDFGEMAVGKRDAGGGGVISWGGRGAVRQGRDKSGDISHIVTAIWPHADDLHEKSETELKTEIQLIWPKIRAQKNVANVQHWEDYWRRDGWTSTYLCRSHSLISFSN